MRQWIAGAVVLLPLVVLGQGAHADDAVKPYKLAVGLNAPLDTSVRDSISGSGFAVSAGYTLNTKSLIDKANGKTSIDASFFNTSGKGDRLSVTGVGYTETLNLSTGDKASYHTYTGVGIGVYQSSLKVAGTGVTQAASSRARDVFPTTTTTNTTSVGGKLFVGVANTQGQFAEATYHLVGKVSGVRADTLAITVGTHF